jgi:hypothetical protein
VADQQFVDEINGPEDPMDDQEEPTVVIVPTDHEGINTQDEIDDAGVSGVHTVKITKKGPEAPFFINVSLRRMLLRRRL